MSVNVIFATLHLVWWLEIEFVYIFIVGCQFFPNNSVKIPQKTEHWHALSYEQYFSKHNLFRYLLISVRAFISFSLSIRSFIGRNLTTWSSYPFHTEDWVSITRCSCVKWCRGWSCKKMFEFCSYRIWKHASWARKRKE